MTWQYANMLKKIRNRSNVKAYYKSELSPASKHWMFCVFSYFSTYIVQHLHMRPVWHSRGLTPLDPTLLWLYKLRFLMSDQESREGCISAHSWSLSDLDTHRSQPERCLWHQHQEPAADIWQLKYIMNICLAKSKGLTGKQLWSVPIKELHNFGRKTVCSLVWWLSLKSHIWSIAIALHSWNDY